MYNESSILILIHVCVSMISSLQYSCNFLCNFFCYYFDWRGRKGHDGNEKVIACNLIVELFSVYDELGSLHSGALKQIYQSRSQFHRIYMYLCCTLL